ncbi:BMP family lipoprotein [Desulfosediminicola flagellatus]|uniref:BMP family lipoprotein n=1 Tax=Desulfosediminicola flagellatus TaxID=2569541 RepID=UPI00142EFE51|nr:BMP family ABC transporter substrate-binding protein [Desulfosediminicola flagellatus]
MMVKSIKAIVVKSIIIILLMANYAMADTSAASTEKHEQVLGLLLGISGLGDQSFNDMTYAGLILVKQEHDLRLVYDDSKDTEAEFEAAMIRLIDKGSQIIVANGFYLQGTVEKYARLYPDIFFILQDAPVTDLPNVVSIIYSVNEGSFLVGALAGMMTKTGVVGFIGGVDIPVMHVFRKGFEDGAKYTNPEVKIRKKFLSKAPDFSGFRDPAAGFEIAKEMYGSGVDIIYAAAGLTGNGVIQAAKESQMFAIGVDSDQDHIAEGFVLTSMMKRLDNATYSEVKKILEGDVVPGIKHYGLKEHGVGLSEMKFTRHLIPDHVLNQLTTIENDIMSGKISVSNYLESMDTDSGNQTE